MRKSGLVIALGFVFGLACSFLVAARNSSGTYTLPTGNPVVTGTSITSTWANTTLTDIQNELTNSLDRNGRGGMAAPLQCSSGTVAAPSLTFSSDTDTGLYRIGANNPGMSAGGTKVQEWSSTGSTFPLNATVTGDLAVTGNATLSGGLAVSDGEAGENGINATGNTTGAGVQGTGGASSGAGGWFIGGASNGHGVDTTGDGTGAGIDATGGDSNGEGGVFTGGATNGNGIEATGAGTGAGVVGVGGPSGGSGGDFTGTSGDDGVSASGNGAGNGIEATGGATNAAGVRGVGGGTTGAGGTFAAAVAATGGTRQTALIVENGDIDFSAVTDPTHTTPMSKKVTAANVAKLWAYISYGLATPIIDAGYNIESVSCASSVMTIEVAQALGNTVYAILAMSGTANRHIAATIVDADTFTLSMTNDTGVSVDMCAGGSASLYVLVFGNQ